MTSPTPTDVSLGEVVRTLQGLQDEIRALRGEHVRRDLYEAHRATTLSELARVDERCRTETERLAARLETQERDRATMRRQLVLVGVAAALGFLSSLMLLVAG